MAISQITYSNTFSHWLVSTNQLVSSINTLTYGNFEKISGTLILNSPDTQTALYVSNSSVFAGNVTINGPVNRYVEINPPTTIYNTLSVNSSTSILASGSIKSNSTISSINVFSRYATVNNELIVANSTILSGNIRVSGNTISTGNTNLVGNNDISGLNYIIGTTYVNGIMRLSGNTISTGNTNLVGNNVISGLNIISGTNIVIGDSDISGNINLSGNTISTGNTNLVGNNVISGTTIITGNTVSTGNTILTGNTNLVGNNIISGTAIITGIMSVSGNTVATGNTNLVGNNVISGTTIITGNTVSTGNTNLVGNNVISGTTIITGVANVSGNILTVGNFTVNGNTLLSGNTVSTGNTHLVGNNFISGNTTISGNVSLYNTIYSIPSTNKVSLIANGSIVSETSVSAVNIYTNTFKANSNVFIDTTDTRLKNVDNNYYPLISTKDLNDVNTAIRIELSSTNQTVNAFSIYANTAFIKNSLSSPVNIPSISSTDITVSNLQVLNTFTNYGTSQTESNQYLFLSNTGSPTSANTEFIVNRKTGSPSSANAILRWANLAKEWQIRDVDNANTYNKITTKNELDGANTFLYSYINSKFSNPVTFTNSATFNNDVIVGGNLTINGTTTTLNTNVLTVDDKNITLGEVSPIYTTFNALSLSNGVLTTTSTSGMIPGMTILKDTGSGAPAQGAYIISVDSATQITANGNNQYVGQFTANVSGVNEFTANGGGITLRGIADKTFNWANNSGLSAWTSSENIALSKGKSIIFNGSTSGNALVQSNIYANNAILTLSNNTGTIISTGDVGSISTKMIAANAITNDKLSNTTISEIPLGSNLKSLSIGTGLYWSSGTNYYGSQASTISVDSTVARNTSNLAYFSTTTSAQLASVISDETGSGKLVFSNNPILVTPEIGMANGTSLILTGLLKSTNAVFTATSGQPFTVSSTTAVTNLNADYLDGQHGLYYTGLTGLAYDQANTGVVISRSAFDQANTGVVISRSAFDQANTGVVISRAAYDKANNGGLFILDEIAADYSYNILLTMSNSGQITTANTSTVNLYFNPNTGTLNSTIFNSLSDKSVKTNITQITNSLNTINNISGVEFEWKNNSNKSAGVIAQQLETILPFLVNTNNTGLKSVNYSGIIAYLIEAIKELTSRIENLEKK